MDIKDFINRLDKAKETSPGQYMACCPAHNDKTPSLAVSEKDGNIVLHCHCGCKSEDVVTAMGLSMQDLFAENKTNDKPQFLRSHIYQDTSGTTIARKDISLKADGSKKCVWYRFENEKWEYGLNGLKVPLYKLPELISSTGTVFIVEGEKDVETMHRLGYPATSSPNGAGSKWSGKLYNPYLQGRDIVIISDNDEAGRKAAEETAKGVFIIAKSVKAISAVDIWSEVKKKGDISDIVQALGDEESKNLLDGAVAKAEFIHITSDATKLKITLPEYIYSDDKGNRRVNPALLAETFKANEHFKLVKSPVAEYPNIYFYHNGRYILTPDSTLKGYIKKYITDFDKSILKMRDVDEVFKNLTTDLETICHDELDSNEHIINFQNGILNLDTMALLPHSPEYLSTIQLPLDWSEKASETPIFDQFMDTLTNGDKETQKLLLQFIGACFSNIKGYRFKKALFLIGQGNTGKSQIKKLIEMIIGQNNCCNIDLADLEKRFGAAPLFGKRLAGYGDMGYIKIEELKTLKLLTGGDPIDFERKGKDKFNAIYNGFLWFCANELPRFGGDRGKWVYDRFIVIKCDNVIPPENRDVHICEKMFEEREGIVFKALQALKQIIANKNDFVFDIPECCEQSLKEYEAINSPAISFYNECCQMRGVGIQDNCTGKIIYEVFKVWCKDNCNGYVLGKKAFRKEISEYLGIPIDGLDIHPTPNQRLCIFTLTTEAKEEYKAICGYDSIAS